MCALKRPKPPASPSNPVGPLQGDPPPGVPRDQWERPRIMSPTNPAKLVGYTRASTLGGTLEDQFNLGQWRMRQVALGIGRRRDLALAAQACTAAAVDKDQLASIAEKAMEAAESNAAATIGTAIHAIVDRIDRGEQVPDTGEFDGTLRAYRDVISHFTVHAIETFVVHDDWQAAGTFDRLVSPLGEMTAPDGTVFGPDHRLVWDLKTSSTANYFGIKFAVQLAVYAGGVPYCPRRRRLDWPSRPAGVLDLSGEPSRDWGLILHAPSGGTTADLWWVDLRQGAELAELACRVRDWRKVKTLVRPAELPRARVPAQVDKLGLVSMLRSAADEDALTRLWESHASNWDEDCTRMVRARLRELEQPPF